MADLADLAHQLLAEAIDGEAVEVCVGRATETSVRVHGGEVESLTVAESHGVGVRVVVNGREGVAHAGSFDDDVVRGLVAEARDNAQFAEPDERTGLASPDGVEVTPIDRWDTSVESTSVDDKIAMAIELERSVMAADERIRGVRAAVYGDTRSETAIVNTNGINAATSGTMASLSTSVMVDDIDGGTRTGGAVDAARGPAGLDAEIVAALAVERGLQLLGAQRPTTGRPRVILEPRFAATILGVVAGMLSGERVVKGRTPFAERVDELIANELLTLFDDPTDTASLSAAATDGEGLACRRVPLISSGRLQGFLHDTRSARGLGTTSTGSALRSVRGGPSPGHRALHVAAGQGDLESLIADTDDGLLVSSLQGLHSGVNAVSGDLSVGVEGVRIREGERAEPIREGTLAGAIPRFLLDIRAVGADLEALPDGSFVPSLAVDGLTLGGAA